MGMIIDSSSVENPTCSQNLKRVHNSTAPTGILADVSNRPNVISQKPWSNQVRPAKPGPRDIFQVLRLPDDVVRVYKETRKIKELYEWQNKCLRDIRLLRGTNFILSLPTGSGKTLVAELLMIRCTLHKNRSCILVLPFIAIVTEKVVSLSGFEESLNICIEEYAGTRGKIPPLKRPNQSIYVCTIEKANILVNALISEGRMNEIGLVIVDEMHMLADEKRGFVLEQCLAKVILTNQSAQIIGLSATLSSIDRLKTFLNAEVFTTDFRPVSLTENIKIGNNIYRYNASQDDYEHVRDLKRIVPQNKDPDNLIPLIDEIIPKRSVLIFCHSKQATENLCQMLSALMPANIRDYKKKEKERIIQQIRDSNDGVIDQVMMKGLRTGVAFHHSGLTRDERIFVESAFKDGIISAICATSTLATGVNLPARRIIIRSTKIGLDYLNKTQYLQMIGRAGRAGLDTEGDSFVFVDDKKKFAEMRRSKLPEIVSGMNSVESLESFILDLLNLKICKTTNEVCAALQSTLYQATSEHQDEIVGRALKSLLSKKFITDELKITDFGTAASSSNLWPTHATFLFDTLAATLDQGLVLSSRFHLLWIIVPYDIELLPSYNFGLLYDEYQKLSNGEKEMLARSGVTEGQVVCLMGTSPQLDKAGPFHRTYVAFMLRRLWSSDVNPADVAAKFGVSRGWINTTLQSVCMHASQISRFCEHIPKFFAYRELFPDLIQQLKITSQKELVQFLALDCIKISRAKLLYDAGYRSIGDVAKTTPEELIKHIHLLNHFQAERIIASAKILFRDILAEKAQELQVIGANTQDIREKFKPNLDETLNRGETPIRNETPIRKKVRPENL